MVNIHVLNTHTPIHTQARYNRLAATQPAHVHTPTPDLGLSQVADDFLGELRACGTPSQVFGHMLVTCTSRESEEVSGQRKSS